MRLNGYQYRLPFSESFATSKKSFEYREGLILEFISENQRIYSEAAPLPGFSRDTLEEVIVSLQQNKSAIANTLQSEDITSSLISFHQNLSLPPALAFAVDCLAYKIAAHRENKSLQHYLFPDAPSKVAVNTVGNLLSEEAIEDIRRKKAEGFETFKFKVGIDFESELAALQKVRRTFPELSIRLDANQSWELEEAVNNIRKLSSLDIEYCEEPLRHSSADNFEQLYRKSKLELAIDETLILSNKWHTILPFSDFVVIKPMLAGSFKNIFKYTELAHSHGSHTIFTTSLESGVGREITAVLASGLGSAYHAHGLATGQLLAEDLLTDNDYISKGCYRHINGKTQRAIDTSGLQKLSIF